MRFQGLRPSERPFSCPFLRRGGEETTTTHTHTTTTTAAMAAMTDDTHTYPGKRGASRGGGDAKTQRAEGVERKTLRSPPPLPLPLTDGPGGSPFALVAHLTSPVGWAVRLCERLCAVVEWLLLFFFSPSTSLSFS